MINWLIELFVCQQVDQSVSQLMALVCQRLRGVIQPPTRMRIPPTRARASSGPGSTDLRRASRILGTRDDKTERMERRKPGPAPRWTQERKQVKVRLPEALADAFHAEVRRRGMTVQDFIGQLAEEMTGVPYQAQEALPLGA